VHRNVHAGQEAHREEEAAHGDPGVPDGGQGRDEDPGDERARRDHDPVVLHQVDRRDQDEGRAGVHVDRRADRKHEARDRRTDLRLFFGAAHRDGERPRGGLREEGDRERLAHGARKTEGIDAAGEEHQRDDDQHLREVGGQHRREVGPEAADFDAALHLGEEDRNEGEDADREDLDHPGDDREEHLLNAREEGDQHLLLAGVDGELRDRDPDRGGDEKDREDVRREEGREDVVRDHRGDEVPVGLLRHAGQSGRGRVGQRHVRRCEDDEEDRGDRRGEDRREERVEDRVAEDPAGTGRLRDARQGRDDRDGDDRDRNELEELDEDGAREVGGGMRLRGAVPAVDGADQNRDAVENRHHAGLQSVVSHGKGLRGGRARRRVKVCRPCRSIG
jgi:hypothetical protein